MRILRSAHYKRMPWKNGKGETVEIAVFPPRASVNDFDWRISMATIAEDGPFSVFDNIDRTIIVLSGDGIVLSVEGAEDVELSPSSAPHAFPGDLLTRARLLGGQVKDLNVMTNRQKNDHQVARILFAEEIAVHAKTAQTIVVSTSSHKIGCATDKLEYLDGLILGRGESAILQSSTPATILQIEIADR